MDARSRRQGPEAGAGGLASSEISIESFGEPASAAPFDLRSFYASVKQEICDLLRAKFGDGPPEPEDMAQAAFAKLAALEDPSKILNPKAFLYAAARNLTLDELRRNGRRRRFEQAIAAQPDEQNVDQASPERVLLAKEQYAIVREAIAAMPAAQQEVLTLHRLEGLSLDAIARRTGMSKTTVHRHVVGAIALLHQALKRRERGAPASAKRDHHDE
jgi:RNA polymerase sigma-70 factor (ECF subfamily)